MIITNWVSLVLADLTKVDEYKALYNEANKSRQLGVVPAFYKEKLNNLREIESVRLFEVEKDKLDEILKMSKSLENYPDLLGTTKLLIEDDNGYSIYDDYPKFKKGLYSAIESDVMVIYDEIERNIEGRFDWMKDNEI